HAMVLEPSTAAGIPPALPILDKVSRERVRVELWKLLAAPEPSRGLRPMVDTGMWPHVLPALDPEATEAAIAAVDRMRPDPTARLARLYWPLVTEEGGVDRITAAIDALRPSRDERRIVLALCSRATVELAAAGRDPVAIRRA